MENYRPRHIDDFCLEPDFKQHIRFLLDNHCDFLLSGPRGCGKTTLVTVHIQEHIARTSNPKSVMVLNNLRDQSINFYRNELKFLSVPGTIADQEDSLRRRHPHSREV